MISYVCIYTYIFKREHFNQPFMHSFFQRWVWPQTWWGGSGHDPLCGSRFCISLLYLVAFKQRRDLRHDVRKCLLHTLFQQPSLTFALRILWVCQGFQWGAQVLQTNSHDSLWQKIQMNFNSFHGTTKHASQLYVSIWKWLRLWNIYGHKRVFLG